MSKKNTLLKQMEFFDIITVKKLTPNQYYLLCCMRDSVTPLQMNLHLELRHLKATGWVTELEGGKFKLSPQAVTLIGQVEKLFKVSKKKTSTQLIGADYKERIDEYISLFPNVKLPSGKAARSAFKNVENCFRWFFENHEYDWETVLQATENYVNEYQRKNWKFMRTSQYFIRKMEADRTFNSDLANYCAIVQSGGDAEPTQSFSPKVV